MATETKKILLAEDDEFLALLLRNHLQKEGFPTIVVHNGSDVIPTIKKERPALLLVNIILPGKSGFEIMAELATTKPKIPFMVISNLSQPEDIKRANEYGALHYFVKSSIELNELTTALRTFFAKH